MLAPLLQKAFTVLPDGAGWPSRCIICRAWPAATLCDACVARFAPKTARCTTCALPLTGGATICGACLQQPPPLKRCAAALPYAWPWTDCIGRWKFSGDVGLTRPLAGLMAQRPEVRDVLRDAEVVLPMPLGAQRLGERGYNPALLLARRLAPMLVRADLLLRTRETPPQRTLGRAARLANVRGAFLIDPMKRAAVAGRQVALVDDVMTTGASLHEAAHAVLEGGAACVSAVVLARTDTESA